jgi:hypothetical protein
MAIRQRKRLLGLGSNEKDLAVPAATLFLSNLIVLIHWSISFPLIGIWCWAVLGSINVGAFLLCLLGSNKARSHSEELSIAKWIGIELVSLLLLLVIGSPAPVMLLVDKDEVIASYFGVVEIGFVLRLILLFCIHVYYCRNTGRITEATPP